jgi:hypothetical protein
MSFLDVLARGMIFLLGAALVGATLFSAIETFVLPRSAPDLLTRLVFRLVRRLLYLGLRRTSEYTRRDRALAFYAPLSLLALLPVWYTLVSIGYTAMFWAVGVGTWYEAFRDSGSSLLTLGFATFDTLPGILLSFSEATIGLILVALLIGYLPTMYAAFSRREAAVTLLEVRAGSPPSAVEMILRYQRIHGLERLSEAWRQWENWFVDIDESHTSLPALVFFRSPQPQHAWVNAAGTVLDCAALTLSTLDLPNDPQAALCIRAGFLALRHIADFFGFPYDPDPRPNDPISITRQEFDQACRILGQNGVPLKADLDRAWGDFAGWRVNYDAVLLALAWISEVPPSPWVGDRPKESPLPPYRLPFRR